MQQTYHSRLKTTAQNTLKQTVQEDFSSSLQENICKLLGDTELNQEILGITNRFKELNALFSDVHNGVGHINPVKETQLCEINSAINQCMPFLESIFRNL